MKRREFIINSALAVGGAALLTACGGKMEDKKPANQVEFRKFAGVKMPLISLGCMRLPMRNNKVDMVELDKMVSYAMEHGANYFDTAYTYVDGNSEKAIGEVLKRYPRKSYMLADKCPLSLIKSRDDVKKYCLEQLKRCQVEYFDNYLVHNIDKDTISIYRENEVYKELVKLKRKGLIKHIGFSFHGDSALLEKLLREYKWDFCQLQINYFDWEVFNVKELYDIAAEAKVPIIVMAPLRSGTLFDLPNDVEQKLQTEFPNETSVSFGLRYVAGLENVITVLSGMSNIQQLKQNINTFVNYKPMTDDERLLAVNISSVIQENGAIKCNVCKSCKDVCPVGINIPGIFGLYNMYKGSSAKDAKWIFVTNYNSLNEQARADKCINCNLCAQRCTKGLKIPELLKMVHKEFEKAEKEMVG